MDHGVDDITSGSLLMHPNDFILPDFSDHGADFDPFPILIPGETIKHLQAAASPGYIDGSMVDGSQFSPVLNEMFGFNDNNEFEDSTFFLDGIPGFPHNIINGEGQFVDDDEEVDYSSATTTNTSPAAAATPTTTRSTKKTKSDRSRTLISERRRRGRMKEKLYALRALVPNITKMDKASIVGDAVLYVQELQMQAKKLKADITSLQASLAGPLNHQHNRSPDNCSRKTRQASRSIAPASRNLFQIELFQVEERGFYARVVSNRGVGVAASLYKALESLTSFNIQSSNLASSDSSDRFIFSFSINIKQGEPDIDTMNLKLWITGSLLNQGFELIQTT